MDKVFIDSSAFIAVHDYKDSYHRQAKETTSLILATRVSTITTNFIIDETLTHLLIYAGFKEAAHFGRRFFEDEHEIEFMRIDKEQELEAWQVFQKYNRDKKWSFTDCTSFVVMRDMGIKAVFTFDRRDFRQMGFKVL